MFEFFSSGLKLIFMSLQCCDEQFWTGITFFGYHLYIEACTFFDTSRVWYLETLQFCEYIGEYTPSICVHTQVILLQYQYGNRMVFIQIITLVYKGFFILWCPPIFDWYCNFDNGTLHVFEDNFWFKTIWVYVLSKILHTQVTKTLRTQVNLPSSNMVY